jgi:hypothetical protein
MHRSFEMPRAAQIAVAMPTYEASLEKSDQRPLDPIVLFGGIGLMALLIAILTGVQGVWY